MVFRTNIFSKQPIAAVFLILLAGITAYANTFHVPFILDDHIWITLNKDIKELGNFLGSTSGYNSIPNRYIGVLTLALNYHFGKLDVTGYHLVNLGIHLITSLLVYALLRLTFRTPFFKASTENSNSQILHSTFYSSLFTPYCFIPLFAALLFVVHPVQTQAVTYIVQRMTSLTTLFYLLSIVLYIQARLSLDTLKVKTRKPAAGNKESADSPLTKPGRRIKPGLLIAGSVFSAILAMRTKEISFTLPLAASLYELFFFRGPWKQRLFYLLPLLATLPIIPLTVFGSVIDMGGHTQEIIKDVSNLKISGSTPRMDYLFTQFRVIVTYLRLLVLPVNQNLDYDYPIFTTFLNPQVFLSFLLLAAIFFLGLYLFYASRLNAQSESRFRTVLPATYLRLISFGILWFFLTISVESSLVPILDVIAEHRLYLANFGAATAFATSFFLLGEKISSPTKGYFLILGASALVLVLGFATFQRNHVWGNDIRLWQDVVAKSPKKARPYSNLGQALNNAGRPWDAIPVLAQALTIAPYFDRANFNLARSYLLTGQSSAAIPLLQKAIQSNPGFTGAYSDLGAAFIKSGRYREAATFLEQNLDRLADLPQTRFNLGVAYFNLGNLEAARRELRILAGMDPGLATKLAKYLAQ